MVAIFLKQDIRWNMREEENKKKMYGCQRLCMECWIQAYNLQIYMHIYLFKCQCFPLLHQEWTERFFIKEKNREKVHTF